MNDTNHVLVPLVVVEQFRNGYPDQAVRIWLKSFTTRLTHQSLAVLIGRKVGTAFTFKLLGRAAWKKNEILTLYKYLGEQQLISPDEAVEEIPINQLLAWSSPLPGERKFLFLPKKQYRNLTVQWGKETNHVVAIVNLLMELPDELRDSTVTLALEALSQERKRVIAIARLLEELPDMLR